MVKDLSNGALSLPVYTDLLILRHVLSDIKRAGEGTRTPDLLITNQLLYQLSYAGLKNRPIRWYSDNPVVKPDL